MTFLHAATWAFVSLLSGLAAGYWCAGHADKVSALLARIKRK